MLMNEDVNPWDIRYANAQYVYGTEPNQFFKHNIDKLLPGKILLPAEGEGRNAVYAAQQGWMVDAMDSSIQARHKALYLAEKKNVSITYQLGTLLELQYPLNSFDCIALIFAHFEPEHRSSYHQKLTQLLKPGGTLILEAFGTKHPANQEKNPQVGGPTQPEFLISPQHLQVDFSLMDIVYLKEEQIELSEGLLHQGTGSLVRMIAKKPIKNP